MIQFKHKSNVSIYLQVIRTAVMIEVGTICILLLFIADTAGEIHAPFHFGDGAQVSTIASKSASTSEQDAQAVSDQTSEQASKPVSESSSTEKKFIKYVEFNVSYSALCKAYDYDVTTYSTKHHIDWIELLAYVAARTGGEFGDRALKILDEAAGKLQGGMTIEELTDQMEYYPYYKEAYSAVLGGMVGEYDGKYGLCAYSPIAKGFDYSSYDDFGTSRSYGYSRPHLGHDMMGLIGTPVISVEDGTVEALGWNQYGGWRIGIRSTDRKRYYYYAHLRQNRPYAEDLKEGQQVKAGDVIGYMGHTGYSSKENTNNIESVHLHFGLELVFDESQKESDNEIWVDCYALTEFLKMHRSEVVREEETKEWRHVREYLPNHNQESGES